MTDYTPTTEDVKIRYSLFSSEENPFVAEEAFHRWLAEVKAQAWEEGAKQGFMAPRKGAIIVNPYKTREN